MNNHLQYVVYVLPLSTKVQSDMVCYFLLAWGPHDRNNMFIVKIHIYAPNWSVKIQPYRLVAPQQGTQSTLDVG